MYDKDFRSLNLSNDFLFAKVMDDSEVCRRVLEKILNTEIERVEKKPLLQNVIENSYKSKGIRIDVYIKDDKGTVYDIEMQTSFKRELPRRSRYYQGAIDLDLIKSGESYKKLNDSIIIFICTFDPFNKGQHYYSFTNRCDQIPDLGLGDGTKKIFLNTRGTNNDVSEELDLFLRYIENTESDTLDKKTDFLDFISNRVYSVKNDSRMEDEYMTAYLREQDIYDDAIEEGIQQGIQLGEQKIILSFLDVLDIETIAQKTGFSVEEINELKEKSKK